MVFYPCLHRAVFPLYTGWNLAEYWVNTKPETAISGAQPVLVIEGLAAEGDSDWNHDCVRHPIALVIHHRRQV